MRRVVSIRSVGATTTDAVQTVTTPDDNNIKTLRRVYVRPATTNLQIYILRAGFQLSYFDASRCGVGDWPIDIDEQYPALIQFQYQIVNATNGTVVSYIEFEYEPGAMPGSRPAPNTGLL